MFSTNCEVETKPFPCVVCLLVLQLRLFEIFHLKGRVGGFDSHVPKVLTHPPDPPPWRERQKMSPRKNGEALPTPQLWKEKGQDR